MKKILFAIVLMIVFATSVKAERPEIEFIKTIETDSFRLSDIDVENTSSTVKDLIKLCARTGRHVTKWEIFPFTDQYTGKTTSISIRLICIPNKQLKRIGKY